MPARPRRARRVRGQGRQYTHARALEELELAKKNRRADFGVFVIARGSAPPGLRPLARLRNDVIVVWDAEDPSTDPYLLAAVEIARACLIEFHRGAEAEAADWNAIDKAINEIEKRAQHLEKIQKPAETIRASSETILQHVAAGKAALERQVATLREKLASLRTAEGG